MVVASTRSAEDGLRDFRAVYRAHYGFVWHALHRFGVAPAVVDDAVQDVFVVAYRRRDSYRGPTPKPWLYGIARRVASNYRRSLQRRAQRDQALPRATRPPAADGTREIIEGLERYLAGLRSEDRELFVLSEIEGMTGPELASATGRNVQTIYTRVRKLKVELGEHVGGFERVRRERPQATARSWALLLPVLRESAQAAGATAAAAATGWSVTTWSWAVGAVGVASLAIVAAALPDRDRAGSGAATDETHASAASPAHAPGERGASPGASVVTPGASVLTPGTRTHDEPAAAPPTSTSSVPRVVPAVPEPAPSQSPATLPTTTEPGHDDAARTSSSAPTTPAPPSDSLGVETELLRRASTELTAGNATAALRTTIEHARRFPESPLADLRTAVRIEALCALGKAEQARGEAELFLREHPGSPVAERIEDACAPAS